MAATDDFFGLNLLGLSDVYQNIWGAAQQAQQTATPDPGSSTDGLNDVTRQNMQNGGSTQATVQSTGSGGSWADSPFFDDSLPGEDIYHDVNQPPSQENSPGKKWAYINDTWWEVDANSPIPDTIDYSGGSGSGNQGPYVPPGGSNVGMTGTDLQNSLANQRAATSGASGSAFEDFLSNYLQNALSSGQSKYGGPSQTGNNYWLDDAFNTGRYAEAVGQQEYGQGKNAVGSALGFAQGIPGAGQDAWNQAWQNAQGLKDIGTQGSQQGMNFINSMFPQLMNMGQTGGMPDIANALAAIQKQGMQQIEQSNAQLREKYGQQGLGHGSDINEALARGSSTGISNINSAQSQLMAQMMDAAAGRQLGAQQAAPSYTNAAAQGAGLQLQGAQAGQSAMNDLYGQFMNSYLGSGQLQNQASNNLLTGGLGLGDFLSKIQGGFLGGSSILQSQDQFNVNNPFSQWMAQQQNPNLSPAVAFATGQAQAPVVNGGGGASGALGAFASMLPMLMMLSSRKLKERIEPLDSDLSMKREKTTKEKLASLPLYKWSYKGDKTRHMGPMAEEFQETFGVGDGVTLHPVDLFGVMLASVKEMANA